MDQVTLETRQHLLSFSLGLFAFLLTAILTRLRRSLDYDVLFSCNEGRGEAWGNLASFL